MDIVKIKAVAVTAAAFLLVIQSCAPSPEFLRKQGISAVKDEQAYIRVLVLKTNNPVRIDSDGGLRVTDIAHNTIEHETGLQSVVFAPDRITSTLLVDGRGGSLKVNGIEYRGLAEIHRAMGSIEIVNLVKMEDYLCSVVPSEMSSSWPIEALKAQAIAARTYAYFHILKKNDDQCDLDATTSFQVYKGMAVESESTTAAVRGTEGVIISYDNQPIQAFFHSTCGGRTMDSALVWKGDRVPYLVGVPCEYCSESPHYRWKESLPIAEIQVAIAKKYPDIGKIKGISFERYHGYVLGVTIVHDRGMLSITGNDFRLAFPEKRVRSMFFESLKVGNALSLDGRGWGHGVGMCQYGARGMAMKGLTYKEILSHYYRGVKFITFVK